MLQEPYHEATKGDDVHSTISATVLPFRDIILNEHSKSSLLLFAGALILFLIASLNIMSLFVAKYYAQQRIFLIHHALGANTRHLLVLIFSEVFFMMLCATGSSLIFAAWGVG